MATACLSRQDFSSATVPRVCPVTGQAAQHRWDLDARSNPKAAAGTLIVFGVFTWLLAKLSRRTTVAGTVWLSQEALEAMGRRRRARTRIRTGALVGALGIGLLVFALPWPLAEGVRVLLMAAAVGALVAGATMRVEPMKATLDDTGRWVMLDDVHPVFAQALWPSAARPATRGDGSIPES